MTDIQSEEAGDARRVTTKEAHGAISTSEAHHALQNEKNMSLWQALKTYPKAAGWSILFSTAIVMEGFDLVIIGSLIALEQFKTAFGVESKGEYQITAAWQTGLTNGAYVGEIIGLMVNGWLCDRFGYRKTIMGCLFLVACFVFITFFMPSLPVLLVGEILLGIPWGAFQTLTTTYASEVCPVVLRPYLTTYVNLCWVIGQFLATGVMKGVENIDSHWAYKIPFACQWIWPLPIMLGVFLAPESPWWLVRRGRIQEARKSLMRLTSRNDPNFDLDETISLIERTNELEQQINSGTSYWDCFKGVNLRRTEIVCMSWAIQTLCGSTLIGYSTYFFEQAGLAQSNAFTISLVMYALGAVGTMASWFLMGWFGRRTLYLSGQAVQGAVLLIAGILGCISDSGVSWGVGAMLLVYTVCYDATVGPVCYSLISELSSTRLRIKSAVLARNFYNITQIITNILTPRMLNPQDWNWGAKTGFFWAASCFLALTWSYFRLPEPKGRSYAELDVLFERKVPARKFTSTEVEPFESSDAMAALEKKDVSAEFVENLML
ncbi:sugar transporter [Penicillium sp. IBT 16267x]|nr:sugar transporter [Penicillium sp. IBT 16267x]